MTDGLETLRVGEESRRESHRGVLRVVTIDGPGEERRDVRRDLVVLRQLQHDRLEQPANGVPRLFPFA